MTTMYLSTQEAAERLQVSKYTVLRYISRGFLPAAQPIPGTSYLIPVDAVDQMLTPKVHGAESAEVPAAPTGPLPFSPRSARSVAQQGRRRKGRAA